jgi:single-strand DNA-binding protein
MLNKVILVGRLTRDPELRYTPSGHPVANFTLATDRPFKNAQGEREADFIDVAAWRKLAEIVSQYTRKGQLLAVEGRLEIRSYTGKDEIRRKSATVIADGVRLFPRNGNGKANGNGHAPAAQAEPTQDVSAPAAGEPEEVPF